MANKINYFLICLYCVLFSTHSFVISIFNYYREFIGLFLIFMLVFRNSNVSMSRQFKSFFSYYSLFVFLLVISSLFLPTRKIYSGIGEHLLGFDSLRFGKLYVLRNALVYLPLVFSMYYFKISHNRFVIILKILFFGGLTNIICFLSYKKGYFSIALLNEILIGGSDNLGYNSFVPYLSGLVPIGIYLMSITPKNSTKVIYIGINLLYLSYIIASSSRQSFIFVVISILIFLMSRQNITVKSTDILIKCSVSLIFFSVIYTMLQTNNQDLEKFASIDNFLETSRLEKAKRGLNLLSFDEFIYGAGIDCVLYAGPHNDYIRWLQRLGIFGSIVSVAPFFYLFFTGMKWRNNLINNSGFLIITLNTFCIYNSLFGYPREDSFQGPLIFLSIGLTFVIFKLYSKNQSIKLRN